MPRPPPLQRPSHHPDERRVQRRSLTARQPRCTTRQRPRREQGRESIVAAGVDAGPSLWSRGALHRVVIGAHLVHDRRVDREVDIRQFLPILENEGAETEHHRQRDWTRQPIRAIPAPGTRPSPTRRSRKRGSASTSDRPSLAMAAHHRSIPSWSDTSSMGTAARSGT